MSKFEQCLSKNKQLLLSGFGVGLSWGSVVLNFDKVKVSEMEVVG